MGIGNIDDNVIQQEPEESARAARLRYMDDSMPGYARRRSGKAFSYYGKKDNLIREPAVLRRIKSLAIPPAWTDVWICPYENGHIQATGRDAKGRKQYKYHSSWIEIRDEVKYNRVLQFARALPAIRAAMDRDMQLRGLSRRKVVAAVLKMLELTLIRVGNQEYARDNKTFGLTTMQNKHVEISGSKMRFRFKGKSGVQRDVAISEARLARIVRKCQDLTGQHLFEYIDEEGAVQQVSSDDVNEYLREISGQDFTAKDFRTWAGTVLASMALQEFQQFDSEAKAKKNVVEAVRAVAARLGNTPAVCRKCYVHPAILDAYMEGSLLETVKARAEQELEDALPGLRAEEGAVLAFLQRRLTQEIKQRKGDRNRSV